MYAYMAGIVLDIVLLLFFFMAAYYFVLGICSFLPKREEEGEDYEAAFAVLIPAHNEAQVLPGLLASIRQTEYAAEKIGVFVIADRCMDRTAEIARQFGAHVLQKRNGTGGKGAALRFGCEQLREHLQQFDYITVIDADNLVDSRYFLELNRVHNTGKKAVQAYVDVKNPYTSWISLAYALWYWIPNRLQRMARCHIGRSVRLQGTGFSVETEQFFSLTVKETGMAEDAEYTARLEAEGNGAAYAKYAVVYDEKPDTFRASVHQRVRWVQGLCQAQKKFRKCKDVFLIWGEGVSAVVFFLFFIIWIAAGLKWHGVWDARFLQLWTHPLNYFLLNIYIFGSIFMAVLGLWMDKKWNSKIILNIFGYIFYILSWIPVFFIGIVRRNKNNWYHTEHHGSCGGIWRI